MRVLRRRELEFVGRRDCTMSESRTRTKYTYDSFGKLTATNGSLTNPFRYTGREFDSETGLYYYRARYYDPTTGRFLSEDPIEFKGGINFYTYVGNNAPNLTDPEGNLGFETVSKH